MERVDTHFDNLSQEMKKDLVNDILGKKTGDVDLDWSEIADRYDLDCVPDTLRKAAVGVKLVSEAGLLNEPPKADKLFDENVKERIKLRELIGQMKETERQLARQELLQETVKDAIASLPPLTLPEPHLEDRRDLYEDDTRPALVVGLGDFHFGADWEIKDYYGRVINKYNPDCFGKRMMDLKKQIEFILIDNPNVDVHFMFVGDLIDGMLRQSQLMKLRYGVVESTIKLSEFLSQWLEMFAQHFDNRFYVHMVTGNHSEIRPLGSKKDDFENENMEKVVWWYMKERLKSFDRIKFQGECGKLHAADICGYRFLLIHGDGSKDVASITRDAINMYGEEIDYVMCGHLHKEMDQFSGMTSTGNSFIVRVPSICGTDRYAQRQGFGGKPGAIAMLIEHGYGRRCVWPITIQE